MGAIETEANAILNRGKQEGLEEGRRKERVNTEREHRRAEAAEQRASAAEQRASAAEQRASAAEQKANRLQEQINALMQKYGDSGKGAIWENGLKPAQQ